MIPGKSNGWLFVDKPCGVTCTKVGSLLKRFYKIKSVGHVGTLDPLASGVLLFALEEATKFIPYLTVTPKTYIFDICWGEMRTTGDAQGEVIQTSSLIPNLEDIASMLPSFLGEQEQTPPLYSAVHVDGKRAYERARAGEVFEIKSRMVHIYALDLISHTPTTTRLRVQCGTGTYVRSLACDLAQKLGACGFVSFLRRTQDYRFCVPDTEPENNEKNLDLYLKNTLNEPVMPIGAALDDIPASTVSDIQKRDLLLGRFVEFQQTSQGFVTLWCEDEFLGIGLSDLGLIYPKRLVNQKYLKG